MGSYFFAHGYQASKTCINKMNFYHVDEFFASYLFMLHTSFKSMTYIYETDTNPLKKQISHDFHYQIIK
jgi:hypothetical protein